jgi:hypothetical protein
VRRFHCTGGGGNHNFSLHRKKNLNFLCSGTKKQTGNYHEKKIEIFLGKVDEGKNDFVLERDLLFAPVVEPRLAGC